MEDAARGADRREYVKEEASATMWSVPNGGWLGDEAFSVCIGPWQMVTQQRIWNDFTHYLSYVIYLLAWGSPVIARGIVRGAQVGTAGLLVGWIGRCVGWQAAGVVGVWMLLAPAFVAQGMFATEIGLSILPGVIALTVIGRWPVLAAGLAGPAVLVYPPSGFVVASLVLTGWLLRRVPWRGCWGLVIGGVILVLVRGWVSGMWTISTWGGRPFGLASWTENMIVMGRDLLVGTHSFDALVPDPYLTPVLLVFLVAGLTSRLGWWGLGTMLWTLALAACAVGEPGIRRAFAGLPMLGLPLAVGWAWWHRRLPWVTWGVTGVLVVLGMARAFAIVGSWPVPPWSTTGVGGIGVQAALEGCTAYFGVLKN